MNNKKHILNKLLILIFLAILILPGSYMLLFRDLSEETHYPIYTDTTAISNVPKNFNAYFNNNFGLRKSLIRGYSSLRIFGIKETYIDDKIIVGNNGWLYYGPQTDGYYIGDYEGKIHLSSEELQKIADNIEEQYKWLQKRGIKFLVVICPNKQTIYPENLPGSIIKGKTVLDQIMEYLPQNSTVPILDLRPVLLDEKNKSKRLLYYKTDTHWNQLGAFYGYKSILEKLNTNHDFKIPALQENFITPKEIVGRDIPSMMGIESFFQDSDPEISFPVKTDTLKKPKLVIFHDSYFYHLQPFFEKHFDTIVTRPHFWNSFDHRVIEEIKPDYVIYEMVERYTDKLLRDNPKEIRE